MDNFNFRLKVMLTCMAIAFGYFVVGLAFALGFLYVISQAAMQR